MKKVGFLPRAALWVGLLVPLYLFPQNYAFGPNVRVNDDSPGTCFRGTFSPGQHLIPARGDTVYLVWRDDRTGTTHVYFARSNDGGRTFLPNVRVDRTSGTMPSLEVDNGGAIHVAWLNGNDAGGCFAYYAGSTDGGQTFRAPVRACDSLEVSQYAMPSIAVDRDGRRIYVVRSLWNQVWLSRSTDGGETFVAPDRRVDGGTAAYVPDAAIAVFDDSVVMIAWTAQIRSPDAMDILFARSTNGGDSFSPGVLLIDTVGDKHAHDWASVGVDRTGRVYAVWSGSGDGLGMTVSTDTGRTFPFGRGLPVGYWGAHPSVAVGGSGRLYLTWDFWTGGYYNDDVRFSCSSDGGETFAAPVNPAQGPDSAWQDYSSVAVSEDGRVLVAWSDSRFGQGGFTYDIYCAAGTRAGIEEQYPNGHAADALHLSPNPCRSSLRIEYQTRTPGPCRLEIADCTGRTIAEIAEVGGRSGRHVTVWNCRGSSDRNVSPGIYFVRLRTPDGIRTGSLRMLGK
jgi:hypothetical protein